MKIFKSLSLLLLFVVIVFLIVSQSHANGSAIDARQEQIQQEILLSKEAIFLDEVLAGAFSARTFNGSWISDTEILFRDSSGHLVVSDFSTPDPEPSILVSNNTLVSNF
jgi:hypothetical protein